MSEDESENYSFWKITENNNYTMLKVAIIMGSTSDYEVMSGAEQILTDFGIEFEKRVISAHRTPELMFEYTKGLKGRGFGVVIAGAGGAAHLAGVAAGLTTLPVIAVPMATKNLGGLTLSCRWYRCLQAFLWPRSQSEGPRTRRSSPPRSSLSRTPASQRNSTPTARPRPRRSTTPQSDIIPEESCTDCPNQKKEGDFAIILFSIYPGIF